MAYGVVEFCVMFGIIRIDSIISFPSYTANYTDLAEADIYHNSLFADICAPNLRVDGVLPVEMTWRPWSASDGTP